ncbi:Protein of unknown function [Phyllobacterium sp. YR620]|uniref:DUF3102 domain-containing protein n=1 Tax=Phyllobacterium sp. YR620 TaxID=1881066 RepID=UPI00088C2EBE|nr:DUF3102 domain-containing protein [Phyllobacterium sp. YR620]SDP46319.1 Protein of unknown function [Phyllobacterium sp. YR620]
MSKASVETICSEFEIEIVPANVYPEPGQTRAVATMRNIMRKYGEGHFRLVMTTLGETKGNNALIDEASLWATSDLIRACPDWVENRTSEWLEWWDRIPLGTIMITINQLRGKVHQRYALAGAIYFVLSQYSREGMSERVPSAGLIRRAFGRVKLSPDEAIEAGRKLLKVKASLPHGQFGPWLEKKSGVCHSTAMKYMRLAKQAA